ncbi:cyclic peptide export ABC transporter [Gilvimarinus sp. SDUM040013]|uniref:Cyclic peptide export ABC transporter n=1 Tax=Gilvimarinus gilvus TaxID=3058038 RepID=A0ABU4S2M2_9GAMM|nr:cyclic peptide export ABC transporter [Gilvimarinus sp. SDUM040013]MDO3384324.1 cyclic peptide export ABC transporter [Gilvimarinus sp. SDUM040013]MDX6851429.1 cyclic peptide export ABC transporter [Gilvimarinus sp. SDUM040013]
MKFSSLSSVMWGSKPNLYFLSMLLGGVSGIGYALLIPFIMYGVNSVISIPDKIGLENTHIFDSPTRSLAMVFFVTCAAVMSTKAVSMLVSAYVASKANFHLKVGLYNAVSQLSYARLLSLGQSKIVNLISVDVPEIINAAINISTIMTNLFAIVGCLAYLFFINVKIFVFVLLCLLVFGFVYQIIVSLSIKHFSASRAEVDKTQEGVRGLIFGVKELKLNEEKLEHYLRQQLTWPESSSYRHRMKGFRVWSVAESYGSIVAFLVVGVTVFHIPYVLSVSSTELFGVVMALLYLTSPVGSLLMGVGQLAPGKVALSRLNEFYRLYRPESVGSASLNSSDVSNISLRNVCFEYPSNSSAFCLSNINIKFEEGKVTFIVGGNGSGKSTLAKIITTHQAPTSGALYFNDEMISPENLGSAREKISAIYMDFFLFNRIFQSYDEYKANEYLSLLGMNEKVNLKDGSFSTLGLSDGQRKRLALFCLLLENTKICLFDEWAADQDPDFKEIFYRDILPMLKEKGKIVIVISHDDRYFDCADQLIRLDYGCIVD